MSCQLSFSTHQVVLPGVESLPFALGDFGCWKLSNAHVKRERKWTDQDHCPSGNLLTIERKTLRQMWKVERPSDAVLQRDFGCGVMGLGEP
eukprot:s1580_g5.t1